MGSYYFAFIFAAVVMANEPTLVFFEIHQPRGMEITTDRNGEKG